jgi:hypothetical protein
MKKTYAGSCHCKAIRFECDIDLAAGTRRCNCSFCAKAGFWKVFAMQGAFRLLQGEEALADYQASPSEWPEGHVHHYFCRRCGMRPFSKGFLDMAPFNGEFHAVNIACLDDATDEELATAPIQYEDGRDNRWESAPAETRHL